MDENVYRYTLGMIYYHCVITNRALMRIAHCGKNTLDRGKKEFREGIIPDFSQQRKKGAGRKKKLTVPMQRLFLNMFVYGHMGLAQRECKNILLRLWIVSRVF